MADLLVLCLDAAARAHLRRALLGHRTWCRAQGLAEPTALADLGRLLDSGGPERPEDGSLPVPSQAAPVLLTYDEAGEVLNLSGRQVRRLVAAGRLRAVAVGRARRIHRADVEAFAHQLQEDAAA